MKRCPQCNRIETDEALKFCRVDGATLVDDLSSIASESGTAQLGSLADASEVHTSILPQNTHANADRATAPTTVLPIPSTPATGATAKPRKRKTAIIVAVIVVAVFAAATAIAVNTYLSRKSNAAIESVAVLPFENRSASADSDYLCDGLAESLIYRLSQLPNLKVSPTTSVMRYKGKGGDLKTIASELGVRAVMTGRLVQRGDNLTISVELIDVLNNKLLWGEQYDRKMADLLATQHEIAATIAQKLQVELAGNEKGVTKKYTDNNEAYQLYLKGRFYWNKRTADGLKQSVNYYHQAIEKDPAFALAYSGLAEAYVLFSVYSVALPKDSMPAAKAAALKALAIDDSLAEPHAALGLYYSNYGWDPAAAERELRRAIELKPNYPTAYHWLGDAPLLSMGRFDEAVAAGRRAEELDPLSPVISADTAYILISAKRYDDAIAQSQRALLLDPNFYYTHYILGLAYYEKGMYAEAISECRRSLELNPDPFAKSILALALSKSGGRAEAVKLRDELKEETARRYVPGYFLAIICAAVGDKDEAFKWLEKDFTERAPYLVAMTVDPAFDDLRNDQRFAALRERVATAKLD